MDKLDEAAKVAEVDKVEEKTKMVDATKKVFKNSIRPKFRGSFQAMGGHVFELPEESNDRMQYSKTIDKL